MAGFGVRRDKAALSSGCRAHPAIRSSRNAHRSHDPSLEGVGFEPSVPRDTPKFSTPAHVTCLTSCTRKSRHEREPILRGCRPPPAEPMVRIRLPPAESQTKSADALAIDRCSSPVWRLGSCCLRGIPQPRRVVFRGGDDPPPSASRARLDNGSRMRRESHVRFCERAVVRFQTRDDRS